MRVIVPALEFNEPAHLVLTAEGIPHEEKIVRGDRGYSELISSVWQEGEGFILVERDIAPWPGAMRDFTQCDSHWCAFRYPEGGALTRGLGCVKFSDWLVSSFPGLWEKWHGTDWRTLDGVIGTAIVETAHVRPHYHHPSVAHVRRPD